MRWLELVLLLLLFSSGAEAAPQFVGDVSLSAGAGRWTDPYIGEPGFEPHALLSFDGGIKVSHDLAVIAHGSVTSPHDVSHLEVCDDPMPGETPNNFGFGYVALEAGLGIDYAPSDASWISPWIGMLKPAMYNIIGRQSPALVYGLTGGFDLAADRVGNRVSVVANSSYSRLPNDSSYLDLTVGFAYRFW
jgi:hypothetical protein